MIGNVLCVELPGATLKSNKYFRLRVWIRRKGDYIQDIHTCLVQVNCELMCIPDRTNVMSIDRLVFAFAGSFVLISLLLSQIHSPNWLWFTAFVGANMLQASFTGFCPLAKILKAMGVEPGEAFK